MKDFLPEIQYFAGMFVTLQEERHRADYAVAERFYRSHVLESVRGAESAIDAYERARRADQRAFAAHALFERRPF